MIDTMSLNGTADAGAVATLPDRISICEPAAGLPAERPFADEVARCVVDLTSDAVVAVDEAGRITVFNAAAEALFGCRSTVVLGSRLDVLVPRRAGGEAAGAWPDQGELTGWRADTASVNADVRSARTGVAGRTFTTYLLRDRSAAGRNEAQSRLLQRMTLAIGEAPDLGGATSLALDAIGELTGWAAGELWLPDATGERLRRGPVWSSRDGLADFHAESEALTFLPGDGVPGRVWLSGQAEWIEDVTLDAGFARRDVARAVGLRTAMAVPVLAANRVIAVVVFFDAEVRTRDAELVRLISVVAAQLGTLLERRRAEDALQHRAAELAQSNAELEQFAYVASHDLQEPLRMVASYTQLLARRYGGRLDGDAHEFIGYAVEGVTRMQQLIHDLLALSRVATHGEPFQRMPVGEVVERVLRDLAPAVEGCGATVTCDPLPVVEADAAQLHQVFQNLLENALKFRRAEAPNIRVSASCGDDEWVFAVRDDGIGISEEYFSRIWAIFQRLHSRAEFPGTGIGLSICKKIVDRHGGRMWVESRLGAGSTFFFTLPHRPRRGASVG